MRDDEQKKERRPRREATPEIHRLLPSDVGAECAVLSAMMQGGGETIETISSILTPEHFHHPGNELLFRRLCALHVARKPTDLIHVTGALRDAGELESVGGEIRGYGSNGAVYISEIQFYVPGASMAEQHAEILREKFTLRAIIRAGNDAVARAYEQQDDPWGCLEAFQGAAIDIGMNAAEANAMRPISTAEVMAELESIEARYHSRGKPMGIATGFHDFDRMVDGLLAPQVYVIAGRPAMGKTSLGMNFAENIAVRMGAANRVCAIWSIEMTRRQLIRRMVMNLASISLKRLRDGFMSEDDFPRLTVAATQLIQGKILLDATSNLTIAQFQSRARRAVVRDKAQVLIIDHLHKMRGTSKRSAENRSLELAEIMQGITATAKQLHVPIVVLAQLGRDAAEKGAAKVPTMKDLEWSSVIEQEAHVIGLLHRPIYYAKTDSDQEKLVEKMGIPLDDLLTYAQLIIDKNRDGPPGAVDLKFLGEFTRFESQTKKLFSNNQADRQGGEGEA